MITNLIMENFKAFERESLQLGRLNMLCGFNNSGKSSVIQALRLVKEQKPLLDMGPLEGYIRRDSNSFALHCEYNGESIEFRFERKNTSGIASKYVQSGFGKGISSVGESSAPLEFCISYISADRLGPRNSLPLNIDGDTVVVGTKGEHIVDFLSNLDGCWDDLRVPGSLVAKEGVGVKENIKEWLRVISPGVDFRYESDRHTDIGRTEFNGYRPVHVGFGLSYALPIIASVLIHSALLTEAKTSCVLMLIENPEAHLHPSGQTKMGELLALAASCGAQIVVETHSDHLLNGVRIAVKEGKLLHSDAKCFFFMADGSDEPASVERVSIDRFGMLDHWPRGFFDESESSLLRLI